MYGLPPFCKKIALVASEARLHQCIRPFDEHRALALMVIRTPAPH
jgi:hypothetical protein